jgi:hypothetical protein
MEDVEWLHASGASKRRRSSGATAVERSATLTDDELDDLYGGGGGEVSADDEDLGGADYQERPRSPAAKRVRPLLVETPVAAAAVTAVPATAGVKRSRSHAGGDDDDDELSRLLRRQSSLGGYYAAANAGHQRRPPPALYELRDEFPTVYREVVIDGGRCSTLLVDDYMRRHQAAHWAEWVAAADGGTRPVRDCARLLQWLRRHPQPAAVAAAQLRRYERLAPVGSGRRTADR